MFPGLVEDETLLQRERVVVSLRMSLEASAHAMLAKQFGIATSSVQEARAELQGGLRWKRMTAQMGDSTHGRGEVQRSNVTQPDSRA